MEVNKEGKSLFERSDRLGCPSRWGLPLGLLANAALFAWADTALHASVYLTVTLKDLSYKTESLYNVSVLVTGTSPRHHETSRAIPLLLVLG